VETIGPPQDSSVSAAVAAALQKEGYRLKLENGSVAAELWLRAAVPVQAKHESSGIVYDQIGESILIGVLRFPTPSTDYRGQAIRAGFYTLRYALMPNDGNHLGAAPDRDFLLLSPAAADADPKAVFKTAELLALSRQASGSKHPAPLSLVECANAKPARLEKDEQEHLVFSTSIHLENGSDLPIAVVVKGVAAQ